MMMGGGGDDDATNIFKYVPREIIITAGGGDVVRRVAERRSKREHGQHGVHVAARYTKQTQADPRLALLAARLGGFLSNRPGQGGRKRRDRIPIWLIGGSLRSASYVRLTAPRRIQPQFKGLSSSRAPSSALAM